MFRYAVGALLAVVGSIALAANSYLLATGAIRWAHEQNWYEQLALGAGGAIVPWLLAVWPMLFILVRESAGGNVSRGAGRMALAGLWIVFFGYNFLMGTSNIAKLREDKVAAITHDVQTASNTADRRAALKKQLDGIPVHRPAATVQNLIEAERKSKIWDRSNQCADATAKASRAYCENVSTLASEMASARRADELNAEIATLDTALAAAPPVSTSSADPFVDAMSTATGMEPRWVRVLMAMATPVILELIGAACWKVASLLFGWTLGHAAKATQMIAEPVFNPAPLLSPEKINAAPDVSLEALTAQRKLAEWFFRECTRPVASGAMKESEWFEHYANVCRRSGDQPLAPALFRRIAKRFVPTIQELDGVTYYYEVLPLIPENAT